LQSNSITKNILYATDGFGYYPIHEAVSYDNHQHAYEITKMLADCEAELEVKQECCCEEWPLEIAASRGHLEVIKFLEEKGANKHMSDEKLIKYALREKMDAESIKLLQYLIDRNPDYLANNESKLFKLSAQGDFGKLENILKVGANVHAKNAEGQSLLDVVGTKSCRTGDRDWPKKLEKIKSVLEKAMKKGK
jgi:hypothetical protein